MRTLVIEVKAIISYQTSDMTLSWLGGVLKYELRVDSLCHT